MLNQTNHEVIEVVVVAMVAIDETMGEGETVETVSETG